ncbi:MAG: OmpA family protein, partial [Nitrospirota bacterium]|nr:OmpA family protein [Nitrospirota bacterium]
MRHVAAFMLFCVPYLSMVAMVAGCVSKSTHLDTVAQLEEARKIGLKNADALETFKKQAAADSESKKRQLTQQINGLNQDKTRLAEELRKAQETLAREKQDRESAQRESGSERDRQQNMAKQLEQAQDEHQRLDHTNTQLDQERNRLKTAADALQGQVNDLRRQMASAKSELVNADARHATIQKNQSQLAADLDGTRQQAKELSGKLNAEQQAAAALREDKHKLLGTTAGVQEELARVQKRHGDLESQFTKQLSDRDQEIDRLKQAAADRDALKGQVASLSKDIDHHRQRAATVTGNLEALEAEAERLRQERDRLAADLQQHQDLLKAAEPKLASLNSTVSERDQELDRLRRDQDTLQDVLKQEQERLKHEADEKQRLEQERAVKEAEIERLTKTHEDLTKSLKDDIEKGNITIKQVRDQLTINMVDRVLFDSGKAEIKPAGLKMLKQVGDVLKHVADKQIRIEGHTDNVPIGPKIKDRFPTNWELSTARATSVIRYLIEDGGVSRTAISAGGYA